MSERRPDTTVFSRAKSSILMNKPAEASRATSSTPPLASAPLEIRFGQVGLAQVRIRTTDPGAILDELTGRVATAPQFFERTAVCLDLSALEKEPTASKCARCSMR